MSGDILTFPVDTAATADDYVATEKAVGGRVFRHKVNPADLVVRATGGAERTLAAIAEIVDDANATDFTLIDQDTNATDIGAKANPASGAVTCTIQRFGKFFTLDFTLTAARITVTDGDVSGSHGALKIFDFVQGAASFLGARQNYTAFAEGALLTGAAGDAAFEIGVGTTAISAAADGTLGNGVNENVGQAVAVTLSSGTGTGTAFDGAKTTALDGTATELDLYLNWSGTAATIDATSSIDVTGTITVSGVLLGDD